MDLRIELEQNITISHKMIQSMKILQMSSAELDTFLKKEALENPVMEFSESGSEIEKSGPQQNDLQRKLQWLEETDGQNQVYFQEEQEEGNDDWKYGQTEGELLEDYLFSQLLTRELSKREYELVEYLILSLDSKGYFADDKAETAQRLSVQKSEIDRALGLVKSLEPAGVGAKDLAECLMLQLSRMGLGNGLEAEIVGNYLDLVGKNRLPSIAKALRVSVGEVDSACKIIRRLNPKPGNSFADRERLKYIIPDVVIVKLDGYYEILINEYQYPKITANHHYLNMVKQNPDAEVKDYLTKKIRQLEWISNCIIQRNFTLSRVAHAIVEKQEAFFAKGVKYKKPMKLADIAAVLEVHESTVSRAVHEKYLQCAYGIYPMSYFFSSGFGAEGLQKVFTPEQIKALIGEIIQQEDRLKPLSDQRIMEKLSAQNIQISRRTVAKYREALNIKDAGGRREYEA